MPAITTVPRVTRRSPLIGRACAGFTIVEMIVTIVVSAIIAVGIVDFIGRSVTGLETTAERNQLASAGRTAIDRLAMELHNALPNSIRTTSATPAGEQCIEFIPVRAATSYINAPVTGPGATNFDVVDFVPDQEGTSGGYAVIFPNNTSQLYDGDNGASSNWPDFPDRRAIQTIGNISAGPTPELSTVTLVKSHRFPRRSPSQRFFLVDQPVSYCIKGDKLYRYTNYTFYETQVSQEEQAGVCEVANNDRCLPNFAAAPDKRLITDSLDNTGLTAFDVSPQTLTRNAIVKLEMNLSANGEVVRLNHEVLTRVVP